MRIGSQSGCTACDNGNGCGAGLFAKLLRRKSDILELARNNLNVEPGQMVTLAFPEQIYIKLVLASYGWPLLAAMAGAFTGHALATWLQVGPLGTDLGTLSGGLLVGGLVMRLNKNQKNADTFLNSLCATVYFPSVAPNMCSRNPSDST